ncbi:hypothetical protein GGR58DRAFT_520559 [Xylaria digitata]|nr:hypothetical protein GGR58DRAFT_520559 [Xylaria digitata]
MYTNNYTSTNTSEVFKEYHVEDDGVEKALSIAGIVIFSVMIACVLAIIFCYCYSLRDGPRDIESGREHPRRRFRAGPRNNTQPTAPTGTAQNSQSNSDEFEEVTLSRPSSEIVTGTAQAVPMTSVRRGEPQTDAPSSSTGEQAQGPPFLTIHKVELNPPSKNATPGEAKSQEN